MPATMMLDVGAYRVRVSDSGADATDSRPLLLVGGIGANLELWEPLRRRLPRRTLAVDLPGTGGSATPLLPLTIGDSARLLLQVLDALELEEVDVLGLSFGGTVAQDMAVRAPRRVRRLVLVSTAGGIGSVPGNPLALALLGVPLRWSSPRFFKLTAPLLVGGRGARDERFLDRQARRRAARPPSLVGCLYQLWAAAGWSSWTWLHTLQQPTLVVAGDRDLVVPAVNSRLLAAMLPHGQLRTWPDGGHLVVLDSASRVAPVIEEFLAG